MTDKKNVRNEGKQYLYLIGMVFTTCLLGANLAAIKICNFFGFTLPGGIILFPLLYVLNDILTEVYGFSASRKVVWTALVCNLFLSSYLYLIVQFNPYDQWDNQQAFEKVFSISPRIFVASILSYLIGELTNAIIISRLKIRFKGKLFALRAIFSTSVGALLESTIFCIMAFIYYLPFLTIVKMVLTLTIIKIVYEILVIPISIKLVRFLKRAEGIDVFENPSFKNFLPRLYSEEV